MNMKKAQLSIGGMIMAFVEFLIFVAFFPLIQQQIAVFKLNSTSVSLNLLVDLLPFFILLSIIVGTLFGASLVGSKQQQPI